MSNCRWLMGVVAALALPAAAFAQFPGGGGGGPGGRGRGGMDPAQMFNMVSGGKDVIVVDQLDDRMKRMVQPMLQMLNITNGQITREQYAEGMKQFMSGGGMRGPGGAPGGGPWRPAAPGR